MPEIERETRAKCQNQSGELLIRERSFAEARDFRIESINARFFLPLCGALSSALHFLISAKTEKVATSVGHRILLSDGDFVARLDDLLNNCCSRGQHKWREASSVCAIMYACACARKSFSFRPQSRFLQIYLVIRFVILRLRLSSVSLSGGPRFDS